MLELDRNGDGKVNKSELPSRMQNMFDDADTNEDGGLDEAELSELAKQQRDARPAPPRGGAEKPTRPERPQRPEADE